MSDSIKKGGFSERVLECSLAVLENVGHGATLDDALEHIRGMDVAPACSDLLYRYYRSKASTDHRLSASLSGRGGKSARRKIPAKFARILGLVITQCERQSGIGRHAAVDVAVDYTSRKYGRRVGGFVNAVSRRMLDTGPSTADDTPPHVKHNFPELVYKRWSANFTDSDIAGFADTYSREACLTFRIARRGSDVSRIGEKLVEPLWAQGHSFFRLRKGVNLFESDVWHKGEVYVQDISTLSACLFYKPSVGDTVLDMCSAPGGKMLAIKDLMTSGFIVGCDVSYRRQLMTRENISRTGTEGVALSVCSGLMPAFKCGSADCVMLDVPCTGTGVFRRRPDVLWTFSESKLRELCAIQMGILSECSKLVRVGGMVIYSTCSLEPEENRRQIDSFLSVDKGFRLEGDRMLLPNDLHDGSYAAALRRV
ncbi:MAG: RsmB/NOP family class I SAM-dependent RNA methyltransferase [Victivallales bacterium]|nr:RsmB/NOP family class I SAM-dependent RNA methyltransferase [Victivallales bacterium]